jgi:hypothetical protein
VRQVHAILSPLDGISPKVYESFGIALSMAGWFVDIVLLCRVLAVFPPKTTPLGKLVLILAPAIILKILRVISWILFALAFSRDTRGVKQVSDLGLAATDPDPLLLAVDLIYIISTTLDNALALLFVSMSPY